MSARIRSWIDSKHLSGRAGFNVFPYAYFFTRAVTAAPHGSALHGLQRRLTPVVVRVS